MRLNKKYLPTNVYTRNDFAEAINAKKNAIELKGNVLDEVKKEINSSKSKTSLSKIGKGLGILGTTLGLLSPAGYIGLGGAALYALLFGTSTAILRADEINKYSIYNFVYKNEEHFLLVRTKEFDYELDSIEGYDYLVFSTSTQCPKCKKKGKKESAGYFCPSCHKRIVRNSTSTIK